MGRGNGLEGTPTGVAATSRTTVRQLTEQEIDAAAAASELEWLEEKGELTYEKEVELLQKQGHKVATIEDGQLVPVEEIELDEAYLDYDEEHAAALQAEADGLDALAVDDLEARDRAQRLAYEAVNEMSDEEIAAEVAASNAEAAARRAEEANGVDWAATHKMVAELKAEGINVLSADDPEAIAIITEALKADEAQADTTVADLQAEGVNILAADDPAAIAIVADALVEDEEDDEDEEPTDEDILAVDENGFDVIDDDDVYGTSGEDDVEDELRALGIDPSALDDDFDYDDI